MRARLATAAPMLALAAALVALAAPAVHAQAPTRLHATSPRAAAVLAADDAFAGAARTVAVYHLRANAHSASFPTRIVVGDSAGTLVARMQRRGAATYEPITVFVEEGDLYFNAPIEQGVLGLVLRGENARQGGAVRGAWSLGTESGPVAGASRAGA